MDRCQATGERTFLLKSRDLYRQAFEAFPKDYYTGINAASKSMLAGERETAAAACGTRARTGCRQACRWRLLENGDRCGSVTPDFRFGYSTFTHPISRHALISRVPHGNLARMGDTLWVRKKPSPFSSRSTGF
jgi:hypothetical protein